MVQIHGTINNCYYLDTVYEGENENVNIIKSSSEEMKKTKFVQLLNSSGNNFKMDTENINNGYPILTEKEIINISFKDEILYEKILEKLLHKIENYNDETMTIGMTQVDIDTVTTLMLDNYRIDVGDKIGDISGIEHFTNLTTLDLAFNNISDISKLQYLKKLEYLSLEANNISNIDAISGLEELQTLYLNYNYIRSVPILKCTDIIYLNLSSNKLTDITNLSNLVNLEELYLYNYTYINGDKTAPANAIADISVLDGLEKLKTINARSQRLTHTGIIGEEIELPLIFSQAKNQESVAYTENDFSISNCTLNDTKITLGEDTERKAIITINGGVLDGSTFSVTVNQVELSSIAVKTIPNKTSYYVGDNLNTQGLVLTATYNDGTTEEISEGFECTPSILNTAGTQTITVSYGGKTTTFNVTVILKGDVTGDGDIDFMDILAINKHRLGKSQLTGTYLEVADVTRDGSIDFMDILRINKYRLGKIDDL